MVCKNGLCLDKPAIITVNLPMGVPWGITHYDISWNNGDIVILLFYIYIYKTHKDKDYKYFILNLN